MSDLSLKKETPESFYLSPKEAGILVGYTADYVSKLSRDGVIIAKRDGRNWLVEGNSLKAFAVRVAVEEKKRLEALKEERAKAYKASRDFLPLREAGLLFGKVLRLLFKQFGQNIALLIQFSVKTLALCELLLYCSNTIFSYNDKLTIFSYILFLFFKAFFK